MGLPGAGGMLLVDKPAGMTSHDVVARLRKVFGERRIGHGGTLDPDATGVLVVALGRATRLLRFVSGLDKAYRGEVVLGTETSSLDASGTVTATHDMAGVGLEAVARAAAGFVGVIDQVPPMVSAIKIGGRRLHEVARAGEVVERPARRVEITRLEVGPTEAPGVFAISLECSSGTYVRSLAADIGRALGGGAHLRALRRTRVGPFSLAAAHRLADIGPACLMAPAGLVGHLAGLSIDDDLAGEVAHGRVLGRDRLGASGPGPWALRSASGDLVAVYEGRGPNEAKPAVVLASPDALAPDGSPQ